MVNQDEIKSFQEIFLTEFGEQLEIEEAVEQAQTLIELVRFLENPP